MKQVAKILIGSRAFFEGLEGFTPKDSDWLYIMDSFGPLRVTRLRMKLDGNDCILIPRKRKEDYLQDTINDDLGLQLGKFFVPEFAEYIGLTINDLKHFEKYLNRLDGKHLYYEIIYDSYIENNSFTLTDEQRLKAFEEYKKYRN